MDDPSCQNTDLRSAKRYIARQYFKGEAEKDNLNICESVRKKGEFSISPS